MFRLDLATVEFLYVTSAFSGALAFLALYRNTRHQRGLLALMVGFLEIGTGSCIVSVASEGLLGGPLWMNLSYFIAGSGYMTTFLGIRLLDRVYSWKTSGWSLVVPVATIVLAATGGWAHDQVRSTFFLVTMALASALVAIELLVGRAREPLPTKLTFALFQVLGVGILGVGVGVVWTVPSYEGSLAVVMVVQIFLNFFTGIFVYALVKERTEAALRASAETDPLTGIGNRRRFFARVPEVCGDDAVIIIDADHFKSVNDRHGHQAGDRALQFLVERLRSVLRDGEELARFGGEEFAVFLKKTSADAAAQIAERLRATIEAHPFEHQGTTIALTISLGVHAARAGESVDAALVAADHALYRAKAEGRNRVSVG